MSKTKQIVLEVTLSLSEDMHSYIEKALHWKDGDPEEYRLDIDECISYDAWFQNLYFAEIKCCGVKYEDGDNNAAWTEMVLFDMSGNQVAFTDPDCEYFQKWELEYEGIKYIVNVK